MGISSTTNRVSLAGNGSSTSFNFPYYFSAQTDLLVYIYDTVAGTVVQKTLNTDYTVSGTPNSAGLYTQGGSVVFGAAPSATQQVVIVRAPSFVQNYTLLQNGTISSAALVAALDYLALLLQRVEDQVTRAMKLGDGQAGAFNLSLPDDLVLNGASKVPAIKSDGSGWDTAANWPTIAQIVNAAANAAAAVAAATAAAAQAAASAASASGSATSATSAAASATQVAPVTTGTRGSPIAISAAVAIASGTAYAMLQFVQGNGGAVTMSANPAIAAGTTVGQQIIVVGRSDANTVTIPNGLGTSQNGDVTLGADATIRYLWDGTNWIELNRSY